MNAVSTTPINRWCPRAALVLGAGLALLTVAGCSSSSAPSAHAVASAIAASASSTGEPTSAEAAAQTASAPASASSSPATNEGHASTAHATGPCQLVTADMLATTLGSSVGTGTYKPVTAAGTGCIYTKVSGDAGVNILVETTRDPANYLSELVYSAPAGSTSIPGADRGFIDAPADGGANATILLVKGNIGVLVTIYQDSPPITAANEQKLAAAILRKL